MTTQQTSIIDHAQIAAAVRDIRVHAGDFDVSAECNAVLDAFLREVKEGTDTQDLGIWQEPYEYLVRWLGIIQQKVSEVGDGMRDDADWLEEVSRKARGVQDDAAGKAQSLGQSLDGIGVSGGSTTPKPSTFDPRTFRDVTPSITVPVPSTPSTPAAPENPTPPTGPTGNTEEVAPPTAPATTNTAESAPTPTPQPVPQGNVEETAPTPDPQSGGNAAEQ